jgi:hypothetical protein
MKNLVDFYEIESYELNSCNPDLYNGLTPITKSDYGSKYLYGMVKYLMLILNVLIDSHQDVYVQDT